MTATISNDDIRVSDSSFQPLLEYVISATGLMYYSDRRREFANHVGSRLKALEVGGCHSYLQLLQDGESGNTELDRLIELLTIGETHFFRHRELFEALEQTVVPNLIEKNKRHRRLRIWSAGCSIGAEAYSFSMLLRQRFATRLPHWDIRIIGTDINREFLARASAGHFENWALRSVSAEDRDAFFSHDGKRWTVKPAFREGVSFEYHNLVSPHFKPPMQMPAGFDLILCRNVMIYFSQDVVRQSIKNLHACLAADGWLAVGHAEHNVNWFRSFRTSMSRGAVLYQKQSVQQAEIETCGESEVAGVSRIRTPGDLDRSPEPSASVAVSLSKEAPVPRPALDDCKTEMVCDKETTLQEIRSLADRGELQEALQRCFALQRSDALDASPHFYQALILQQSNDDAGAERSLKRAIYLDRAHLLAHYYLGLLLQKQRLPGRAARSFQNVIKLSSGRSASEQIADADELSVADLQNLCLSHLNALEQK